MGGFDAIAAQWHANRELTIDLHPGDHHRGDQQWC
jgi:hypothetical protein